LDADAPFDASIVISSRNRPGMLLDCLATVAAQHTSRRVEVVAVDQSDPERRMDTEKAEALFHGTPFAFRHAVTETIGASRGRNLGVRLSRGPVIAVTDDDCRVDPGWIEAVCDAFAAEPDLMMLCGRVVLDGEGHDGTIPAAIHPSTTPRPFVPGRDPSGIGSGNNVAYRREALRAVGGYDERLGPGTPLHAGEDTELFYRLVHAGMKAAFRPAAQVSHRAWRDPDELLELGRTYSFGSGVYLTREVIARGDLRALRILLYRLVKWGLYPWLGSLVLGKPWHRRAAWGRTAGTVEGAWVVLSRRAALGIDRDFLLSPPGGPVDGVSASG
jgi:GT2 family glycosyltransferase